jgi:hypothetical protein
MNIFQSVVSVLFFTTLVISLASSEEAKSVFDDAACVKSIFTLPLYHILK